MGVNLHVYQSPFLHESRMLRITKTVAETCDFEGIVIFATWEPGLPEIETLDPKRQVHRIRTQFIPLAWQGRAFGLLRKLEWTLRVVWTARRFPITCANAHSLLVLPAILLVGWMKRCTVIYDTHELETETQTLHGVIQRLAKWAERLAIRYADAVVVVNDSIGDWYRARYPSARVHVVRNVPTRAHGRAGPSNALRKALGIPDTDLVFLYQGGLGKHRGIELLLRAFARVPEDRHLVFMGFGPLEQAVRAAKRSNVHFHPAVPPEELRAYTASADVGVVLYEDVCLNHYYCLPNKIFEYLAAGVPVIVSDFPEMAKVVDLRGAGWKLRVSEDALVRLVTALRREDVAARKPAAIETSKAYCWENEEESLLFLYEKLGFRRHGRTSGRAA